MISSVTLVCRAEEVLENGYRMVSFDNFNDGEAKTFRFKVRYWNSSPNCKFMSFKDGTLLVIMGSLANDENGLPIIVAERVQFLDNGKERIAKDL